jgi:hypothetical protein
LVRACVGGWGVENGCETWSERRKELWTSSCACRLPSLLLAALARRSERPGAMLALQMRAGQRC